MRLWRSPTLAQKLSWYFITATCAVLIVTIWVSYTAGRQSLDAQTNAEALKQVQSTAGTMDGYVDRAAVLPRSIAARQEALGPEPDAQTVAFLARLLESLPEEEAFGAYLAFEGKRNSGRDFMRWVDRNSLPGSVTGLRDSSLPWYQEAKKAGRLYVSDPYFDHQGSKAMVVSVTKPFYDSNNNFLGVAGADLSLDLIRVVVGFLRLRTGPETQPAESSGEHAFLISRSGKVMAHPDASLVMREDFAGAEVTSLEDGRLVARSPEGSARILIGGVARRLYWATAPLTGWKVALNVPESLIVAPAVRLALRTAVVAVLAVALMVLLVWFVARKITEPVGRLALATAGVSTANYKAAGELEAVATRGDELGQLARDFRTMVDQISSREQSLRQAEEERRRSEQHFRSLIENTSDIIAILDRDGRLCYASPALRRVLGYWEEDHLGKPLFDLIPPAEAAEVRASFARAVAFPGGLATTRFHALRKDGAHRMLEATWNNLLADASVAGMVANLRDVTEREQAEQLEKEKKAAEAANQAKSAFLANMSHELRTPLNAIIGYSEMLQEIATEDGQEGYVPDLKKIHTAGRHLLELINGVLDISKIEAGKMDLYLETFSAARLVEDVLTIIDPMAKKNNNTLALECPGDPGVIHADQTKLRQSLFNLLSNACKFAPNGKVTLRVERDPEGNGASQWIRFKVRDSGIGIGREQLSKLFQAFQQADASISRQFGGTGLGLAISRHFCRMMGGDITVWSEPGVGSEFTIVLPVRCGSAEPAPSVETEEAGAATVTATVLVIDDDEAIANLVRHHIARHGFRVESAPNGEEGLRLARDLRPDAILLDVMMPGMDGWSVMGALKSDPTLAAIPVIFLTMVDNKETGFALGAADYLLKPVDRAQLVSVLARRVPQHGPPRVSLVVDDSAESRILLRSILENNGWEVREATDGASALEVLGEVLPDTILLDLLMPGMDGFEFLDRLQDHVPWRSIPVVVVTAKDLTLELREQLRGRVFKILQKGHHTRADVLEQVSRALMERIWGTAAAATGNRGS